MKKALIILLAAMILMLTACGESDPVGTWEFKDVKGEAAEQAGYGDVFSQMASVGGKLQLVFEKGGKGYVVMKYQDQEQKQEVGWEIKNGKLIWAGVEYSYDISGSTMTMEWEYGNIVDIEFKLRKVK